MTPTTETEITEPQTPETTTPRTPTAGSNPPEPAVTESASSPTEPLVGAGSGAINPEIPGPAAMPFFGWRGNLLGYFRQPIQTMRRLRHEYGDVVCLAKGGNDPLIFQPMPYRSSTLFAFGAENNAKVLKQSNLFESDVVRTPKQCPWLGDNMVSANGRERAMQRRTLVPAFTAEHLRAYYPDIVSITQATLDRWQVGSTIDLTHELDNMMAEIASKTFYGQDLRNEPGAVAEIARKVSEGLFSPVTKIPIDLPGTPFRRFLRLTQLAEQTVEAEIDKRRTGDSDGEDVLSMMLKAMNEGNINLPHHHLIGNAFTLYLAGHDVPANALGWALFLLAQHPIVAADLHDELFGELQGDAPSYERMWKLPLLDRVIRESMRVLSPAVLMWRRPTAPAELGGYEIPVGSEVLVSPYMTHVDPEIYEEPLRFKPERWQHFKASPFEFVPFSYGARKCLGAAFAEMLMRLIIPLVVQRYRLELIPETQLDLLVTMTMKPKQGLPVIVRQQDQQFDRSRAPMRGFIQEMVDFG